MKYYKNLSRQEYKIGEYKIVPIRDTDKYKIMQWRNEQLYHLRQKIELTKKDQEKYFKEVVEKLFDKINPDQILFSFLKKNICIGYGGLVHISWEDKNAEISFVLDTELECKFFEKYWLLFLNLIEIVAFDYLSFMKIYVYSFNLRPKLYAVLNKASYEQEAQLKDHHLLEKDTYIDVFIHSKYKKNENSNTY